MGKKKYQEQKNTKTTSSFSTTKTVKTLPTPTHYIYDSNSDDYQTKKSSNHHKFPPIINATSVKDNSSSPNKPSKYSSTDSSYDQQHEEIFHEGINQNRYHNGEFDPDYPKYIEDDIRDAINHGCDIGIEETLDNYNNIERY